MIYYQNVIRNVTMHNKGLMEILDTVIPIIEQYKDVKSAYLFGSYAKGESDEKSDLDIRIDADNIRTLDLCGLMVKMELALNMPVDLIPTDSMSNEFLDSIREYEMIIYKRIN